MQFRIEQYTARAALTKKKHPISDAFMITEFSLRAKYRLNIENTYCVESPRLPVKRKKIVSRLLILQLCWYQTGISLRHIMSTFLPAGQIAHIL
jgi:hypothetical protein